MSHHEGGEFASCSPLPPLRHPGASQTPSLVSEHVWFGPFSVSHTFFLHFRCRFIEPTVSCDHSCFHIFFTIPTTFFYLSFCIENTPLNSVSRSGIAIFILAVSPFKRDAYLPWFLNSFPFPSLKFLFVSQPQAGIRRNQRGVRPHTHRGWPFFRFSLQIVRLFVEFHNVLLMNLLHVRLGLGVWRLEGRPEISK